MNSTKFIRRMTPMRSTPTFVRLQEIAPIPSVDPVSISTTSEKAGSDVLNLQAGMLPESGVDIGLRLQEVAEALLESPACAGRVKLKQATIGDSLVRPDCAGPIVLI